MKNIEKRVLLTNNVPDTLFRAAVEELLRDRLAAGETLGHHGEELLAALDKRRALIAEDE